MREREPSQRSLVREIGEAIPKKLEKDVRRRKMGKEIEKVEKWNRKRVVVMVETSNV